MSTEPLFDRYLGRTLTAEEVASFQARLASNAEFRKAYLRHVVDTALIIRAGSRLELANRTSDRSRVLGGANPSSLRWRVPRISLAQAASLVVVAGGLWWLSQRPDELLELRVAEVSGEANIQHPTSNIQHPKQEKVVAGMELRQGDRVVVARGGKVGLKYDGEATTIDLHSAVAAFGVEEGAKRVTLDSGLLLCTAAPQAKPLKIETLHGVATVVGTRFALDAGKQETTLVVQEGTVVLGHGAKGLEVKAGETAVGDEETVRKASLQDAWCRELVMRVEVAPWDAVDFGKGVFAQGRWRTDARGSPAECLIWNMSKSPVLEVVSFDSARWKRGAVRAQFMLLGDETAAPELPIEAMTPNPQMCVKMTTGVPQNIERDGELHALLYVGDRQSPNGGMVSLSDGKPIQRDVWHEMVFYFDMDANGGPMDVLAVWPSPGDSASAPSLLNAGRLAGLKQGSPVGFGWVLASNRRVLVKGLKFVPLGPDMPPPPPGGWNSRP